MIIADKIIRLRKKNGWSQEELADKVHVSRQAVSKWEAAQTTPDLEKILMLGELFGVTTDYLLKDEIEDEEFTQDAPGQGLRCVTMEDANAYLAQRSWAGKRIALGTLLCILSPICLLLLGALSNAPNSGMTENFAGLSGMAVLLVFVAIAVAIFLHVGNLGSAYQFLDGEGFELAYGVSGMVRERQKQFRAIYQRCNIIGVCLCILAPILLFFGAFTEDDLFTVLMLCAMLVVVGAAVVLFIAVGTPWAGMQRLLREGDFTRQAKAQSRVLAPISAVFWTLATAVYLAWSFLTADWQITWVVWPVAGVLYAALAAVVRLRMDRREQNT